jgi:hypothetical protein
MVPRVEKASSASNLADIKSRRSKTYNDIDLQCNTRDVDTVHVADKESNIFTQIIWLSADPEVLQLNVMRVGTICSNQ